ncbi:hypothetical protein LMG29542_08601 [Paraburkholderia humisilvae]|uniref:Uncharacterized protein n=1 Tax=Paraburkholderia humisilvae TaxID=627669 RepID=A0A6J5F8T7_9BURK|nr:hypothetical protein LMG29542_08601 [Paraburkholderia humisilvae]
MKSADSHLILTASPKLKRGFRFSESRSDLSCHHIRCLRNLLAFVLRSTSIFHGIDPVRPASH